MSKKRVFIKHAQTENKNDLKAGAVLYKNL